MRHMFDEPKFAAEMVENMPIGNYKTPYPNRCACKDCNCKFDTKNTSGVCKSCTNGYCHPQKKGA